MHSTDGSTTSYRLRVYNYGSLERFRFYLYSGGSSTYFNVDVAENVGQWHHVVATYDGAELKVYIDGTMLGSAPFSGTIDSSSNGFFDIGNGFSGQIDEVHVYPRALSAEQVFQRYIETKDGLKRQQHHSLPRNHSRRRLRSNRYPHRLMGRRSTNDLKHTKRRRKHR